MLFCLHFILVIKLHLFKWINFISNAIKPGFYKVAKRQLNEIIRITLSYLFNLCN